MNARIMNGQMPVTADSSHADSVMLTKKFSVQDVPKNVSYKTAYQCTEHDTVKMCSENNEIKKKDQSVIKAQNIIEKSNVFQESFDLLHTGQTTKKNVYLDITDENTPPMKKTSLTLQNKRKIKNVRKPINMQRCKTDRAQLKGVDCWECEKYYRALSLKGDELQKRLNQTSRHRRKYIRPHTPEGFWKPDFSDSDEI